MKLELSFFGLVVLWASSVEAWVPTTLHHRFAGSKIPSSAARLPTSLRAQPNIDFNKEAPDSSFDPLKLSSAPADEVSTEFAFDQKSMLLSAFALSTPQVAMAAAPDAVPSALAAYGHYLSIILIVASIMTERLTVKAGMSIEEEKLLGAADIMTGVAGTALLVSGYYRTTAYGKGWDFYSHEPIFWLKMTFLGIFGALSLFPTITIIQRTVKIQQEGTIEPMSEELAKRMRQILNAELSALAFIPLTATLMSRGVGYINEFPTEIVGPILFGVVTAGGVYKYVKDAISWKEAASTIAAEK